LGVDDVDAADTPVEGTREVGLGGRRIRRLPSDATNGVRILLTERLGLTLRGAGGPVERLDHIEWRAPTSAKTKRSSRKSAASRSRAVRPTSKWRWPWKASRPISTGSSITRASRIWWAACA